jgi:hypothetical protein
VSCYVIANVSTCEGISKYFSNPEWIEQVNSYQQSLKTKLFIFSFLDYTKRVLYFRIQARGIEFLDDFAYTLLRKKSPL